MRRTLLPALLIAGALGACASPSGPPADRVVYRTEEAPAPALDDTVAPTRPVARAPEQLRQLTEAERMAWFQANGLYPYPWYPAAEGQHLGYVHRPADWSWVGPAVISAGALYGLYRLKRHYDWW